MGNSNPIGVPVDVDFTGVTYDPQSNQWTVPAGAPVFSLKGNKGKDPKVGKTKVPPGTNTITWTIDAENYPSGFVPSLPTGGVQFNATDNPQWPSSQPQPVPGQPMAYAVDDNYQPGPTSVSYRYTITVRLTSAANNGIFKDFPHDPEVENEGRNIDSLTE